MIVSYLNIDSLLKVGKIVNEKIKSNNTIIGKLKNTDAEDNKKLELLKTNNQDLAKFLLNFFK